MQIMMPCTDDRMRFVEAEADGMLAIHPTVDKILQCRWTVTHIATGMCVVRARDEEAARIARDRLNMCSVNWRFWAYIDHDQAISSHVLRGVWGRRGYDTVRSCIEALRAEGVIC